MTPAERNQLCADMLPWAQGVLRGALGATAEEFAGLGLLEAIDSYNPKAGPTLENWARQTLYRVAVREFRKIHGRRGYSKYRAQGTTCQIQPGDKATGTPAPDDRMGIADDVIAALHTVDSQPQQQRRITLLSALGQFDRHTQSRILGIASKRLGRASA